VRGVVLLCSLTPLLLLGVFYLPIEPGGFVFWRNWVRAGCGPLAGVLPRLGFDPNDLFTYAGMFGLVWPGWLVSVLLTPVHCLPVGVHAVAGFLWCFGGCCLTLAI
jgi:hypothetical protein